MKKKVALLLFTALLVEAAQSQTASIQATSLHEFRSHFHFTNEYQYLSSDVFLFNADKFTTLVNEVSQNETKKRRKKNREKINQIVITAQVENLKFFSKSLSYPIYSFQVTEDKDANYHVNSGTQTEQIQLFENLPLATVGSKIDLSVKGTIVTNKNSAEVLQYIGTQLQNMSEIPTGTGLMFSLVNEFGKFIVASSQGKKFEFSSTVRMYEEQDFNRQMHSVYVYVFLPEGKTSAYLQTQKLDEYLNNLNGNTLKRSRLSEALQYKRYPYMVVVNYKSKYESKPVVGDHITEQTIRRRQEKNRNAHQAKLIDDHTFALEQQLSSFLTVFVRFKTLVSNYQLNFANKITDDYSKNLFLILQKYRQLQKTAEIQILENETDALFENQFRKQYDLILTSADLYLEKDRNLKNLKMFAQKMRQLPAAKLSDMPTEKLEENLQAIRSVKIAATEQATDEYQFKHEFQKKLETVLYYRVFEQKTSLLQHSANADEKAKTRSELLNLIKSTNCQRCIQEVKQAIGQYDDWLKNQELKIAQQTMQNEWRETINFRYSWLKKQDCIRQNLTTLYPDTLSQPAHIRLLKQEFEQLTSDNRRLQQILDLKEAQNTIETMEQYVMELRKTKQALSKKMDDFCLKDKKICTCE